MKLAKNCFEELAVIEAIGGEQLAVVGGDVQTPAQAAAFIFGDIGLGIGPFGVIQVVASEIYQDVVYKPKD